MERRLTKINTRRAHLLEDCLRQCGNLRDAFDLATKIEAWLAVPDKERPSPRPPAPSPKPEKARTHKPTNALEHITTGPARNVPAALKKLSTEDYAALLHHLANNANRRWCAQRFKIPVEQVALIATKRAEKIEEIRNRKEAKKHGVPVTHLADRIERENGGTVMPPGFEPLPAPARRRCESCREIFTTQNVNQIICPDCDRPSAA